MSLRFYHFSLAAVLLIVCTTSQGVHDDAVPPIPILRPCSPPDSVLDPITHKFRSSCGPRQWCKPTAAPTQDPLLGLPNAVPSSSSILQQRDVSVALPTTQSMLKLSSPFTTTTTTAAPVSFDFGLCVDKGCRRDEFPFGYSGVPFDSLPPQCSPKQYCPDDESDCQPLLLLGQPCQLNRDDSCENDKDTPYRVLCLQGQCRLAAGGLDDICLLDSTEYLGYNESGSAIISTITRDDCRLGLYCQYTTSRCQYEKSNGEGCAGDRECLTFNCDKLTALCDFAPIHLHRLASWAWVLIIITILTALCALVFGLYRVHLSHRAYRSEEIDDFFSQQWQYRHSILSMHAAAALATASSSVQHRKSSKSSSSSTSIIKEKDEDTQDTDSAWTSGLNIKTSSPSSIDGGHAAGTLSPRLCHRRSPSP